MPCTKLIELFICHVDHDTRLLILLSHLPRRSWYASPHCSQSFATLIMIRVSSLFAVIVQWSWFIFCFPHACNTCGTMITEPACVWTCMCVNLHVCEPACVWKCMCVNLHVCETACVWNHSREYFWTVNKL